MKFPYGLSDFATLMGEGYFYQDRSDRQGNRMKERPDSA
jgi:hypothetical protein